MNQDLFKYLMLLIPLSLLVFAIDVAYESFQDKKKMKYKVFCLEA
jgi:hypothetical protein